MHVSHARRNLLLAAVLHAFTHVYQVALLPLYLPIQRDFQLPGVGQATFLVTALMVAYFLPSYPLGALADRVSRKKLLGFGLVINAAAFIGLGLAPNYATALFCVIVAGFGGSFFHPAATAMVARLYPRGTGRALGILGMGASIGFFLGPLYCGWRAATAGWRAPVIELGVFGIVAAIAFLLFAREDNLSEIRPAQNHFGVALFPAPALWLLFIASAIAFSMRDFAGSGMGSLGSLFLQKAHGMDVRSTGFVLSVIFIASLISNPLFGGLSDRGRFRWAFILLALAAVIVAVFPHLPRAGLVPAFMLYGFFFMATFPVIEAALMESVPDAVRGRVFGLFITVGGLLGNISHWAIGRWVQRLGETATSPPAFYSAYYFVAALVLLSTLGIPCLRAIRKREGLAPSKAGQALAQPA